MSRYYTNQTLADDYFQVASRFSSGTTKYRSIRSIIASSKIDIPAFYRVNGSLAGLEIKGIGDETKKTLELILREGK